MSLPNDLLSAEYMPPVSWQLTLNVILKISSGLSTAGSLLITTEILTSKKKRASPFNRLMLGMSVFDALGSSWLFISNWALPEGYWLGARGNYATCQAQAFFIHLTLAVPIYNASLSLYYMLQIRYNWSDRDFARRVEPWVHGLALVNTLSYALLALFQNVYHPTGPLCLESYDPKECNVADPNLSDECRRVVGWANTFTAWWYSVVFISMFFASFFMYLVYRSVRAMEKKMLQWETQWRRTSTLPSEVSATRVRTWRLGASAWSFQNWWKPNHSTTPTASVSQSQRDGWSEEQDNAGATAPETVEQHLEEEEEEDDDEDTWAHAKTSTHGDCADETSDPASDMDGDNGDEHHGDTIQQQLQRSRRQEQDKRKLKLQKKHTHRSRQVARIGLYYLLVYLGSWLTVFICEVIIGRIMGKQSVSREAWFILFIFAFALWPAQGFFNFLIYTRKRIGRAIPGSFRFFSSATMPFSSRSCPSSRVPRSQSSLPSESEPP